MGARYRAARARAELQGLLALSRPVHGEALPHRRGIMQAVFDRGQAFARSLGPPTGRLAALGRRLVDD